MAKIDQIKSWFFEKINKLIYSRQLDKEKKKTQVTCQKKDIIYL